MPSPPLFFQQYFAELSQRLHDASVDQLDALCQVLRLGPERGRKLIVAGNGAIPAIASHVAVDLTKTAGIRAVTFSGFQTDNPLRALGDLNLLWVNSRSYNVVETPHQSWLLAAIDSIALQRVAS